MGKDTNEQVKEYDKHMLDGIVNYCDDKNCWSKLAFYLLCTSFMVINIFQLIVTIILINATKGKTECDHYLGFYCYMLVVLISSIISIIFGFTQVVYPIYIGRKLISSTRKCLRISSITITLTIFIIYAIGLVVFAGVDLATGSSCHRDTNWSYSYIWILLVNGSSWLTVMCISMCCNHELYDEY